MSLLFYFRKSILSYLLVLVTATVLGESKDKVIQGVVLNLEDNQPVVNCQILNFRTGLSLGSTDNNGIFTVVVESVELEILFFAEGFESKSLKVSGTSNTIFLVPKVVLLKEFEFAIANENLMEKRLLLNRVGKITYEIKAIDVYTNVSLKNGRQLFQEIPGVFIYDMDGAGNQLNIAVRGLDAHRSWEFNNRQNGVLTNTDLFGYPASHHSTAGEAIGQIEYLSGTAALQYGAQFGGMINYVTKTADTSKTLELEVMSTVGSFGLISNYFRAGGKKDKFIYNVHFNERRRDGFRENENSAARYGLLDFTYLISKKLMVNTQLSYSTYRHQLAGPLTDAQFAQNPKMSTRARNYYSPEIFIPSLSFTWKPNQNLESKLIFSTLRGTRSSVQFIALANVADTINYNLGGFNARQVDIDKYSSNTFEYKLKYKHLLFGKEAELFTAFQGLNNTNQRRQRGVGSRNSDFDLSVVDGFSIDLVLRTLHTAIYVEEKLNLNKRLKISVGLRTERGANRISGNLYFDSDRPFPEKINNDRILFASGFDYKLTEYYHVKGSISQAYRPVLFKDLIPSNPMQLVDDNIRASNGIVSEVSLVKSAGKNLNWSVTAFLIDYRDKMGASVFEDVFSEVRVLKGNTGSAMHKGFELAVKYTVLEQSKIKVFANNATGLVDARYYSGLVSNGIENISLKGNFVESAPKIITRSALTALTKNISTSFLISYVSKSFADPINTIVPNKSGSIGLVPSYTLLDMDCRIKVKEDVNISIGVNNIMNQSYFTKRPAFYPGPGIWSSDGRNWYLSLQAFF
ncbi:MAG: TonB-dependent receptor family protein [Luteibaculaceae bacterium]